jgi:hypothetical protein
VGGFYYSKGVIRDAAGKKADAIADYEKAIHFSPTNYEARRKLQQLKGKKDVFRNFRDNDITAMFKNSPAATDYPDDNSIYLLKDMQQVIYPENGASEEKNEYLIKILNQSGIEDWKEINLNYNSFSQRLIVDKAEILKKDGSKVQAETNDGQVVFSSLETGDAIHISYKLENAFNGKLAEHFWEDFSFNSTYPVKLARYSLIVPASKKFNYRCYHTSLTPVVTDIGDDNKMYVWESTDNIKVVSEASMPAFDDVSQKLIVSSIPDWNYVANWYHDLSTVKLKADFEIKEKLNELFAGKEKISDLEKAKLIYDYIEHNFSYSNVSFLHSAFTPQRASRTLNSRLGDCKDLAVLFTSMARQAGLDANLVLVQTRNISDVSCDVPEISFNHCIAQLKTGGKVYFIELTDKDLPFSAMGLYLSNSNCLIIPFDSEHAPVTLTKMSTPDRMSNTIDRSSQLRFAGNNAEITRNYIKRGAETSESRGRYRDQSEDDRLKALKKGLSSEFSNALTVKRFSANHIEDLCDSMAIEYQCTVDNYMTDVAGMKLLKLPWSDAYGSLEIVALDKRKFPIELWSFSSTPYDKEVMTVQFPAGRKLVEVPKNISYTCPSLSYSLSYQVKPDRLVITRTVKYLKEYVPTDEYEKFREVVNKMAEADKQQLAFK